MRAVLALVVLAACGFDVPPTGGGVGGGSDGGPTHDAAAPADGPGATGSDAALDAPPAMPDAASCPVDYVAVPAAGSGHYYKVHGQLDQGTASTTCALEGAHLLHLDTQAEADALVDLIDNTSGAGNSGLYRIVAARYRLANPNVWLDLDLSVLAFLPWAPSEPHDGIGVDCALLEHHAGHGAIVADQCITFHEFACECD